MKEVNIVNWDTIVNSMEEIEQLIEQKNVEDIVQAYNQLELDLQTYFKKNNSSKQLKEAIAWHENISKIITQLRHDLYEKIKIFNNKSKVNEEYNKNF